MLNSQSVTVEIVYHFCTYNNKKVVVIFIYIHIRKLPKSELLFLSTVVVAFLTIESIAGGKWMAKFASAASKS